MTAAAILAAAWKAALVVLPLVLEHLRRSGAKSREAALLVELVDQAWRAVEAWRLSRNDPKGKPLGASDLEDAAVNRINSWRKARGQKELGGAELLAVRELLKLRSEAGHYDKSLMNSRREP